jgi:large subunit ribosomal protein L7/L12
MAATKVSTEDWIEELKGISVLELSERIKARGRFDVSATAAAAAPAAAVPAKAPPRRVGHGRRVSPAPATEDQRDQGGRAATGLGLKEAKAWWTRPQPIKEGIEREEAAKLKSEIEAGGTAELK